MAAAARTRIADRVARLGTETAFAVSAEAAAYAAKGNKVYPFHIGDMNLPTPENVQEAAIGPCRDGRTGYCPNAGIMPLREALAAEVSRIARHVATAPENVAIQPGGKPVIEKFLLTLVNPGDEVLYPNPGFPIYESQIEFQGGKAVPYGFVPGTDNFLLDFEAIERSITPRTRAAHLQQPAQPHRAPEPAREIEALAELCLRHDLTCSATRPTGTSATPATRSPSPPCPAWPSGRSILYTFSKKFAMTGWRLGGAIGPREVISVIATLNVNEESCTNHFVQFAGVEALTGDQSGARTILGILQERRDVAVEAAEFDPRRDLLLAQRHLLSLPGRDRGAWSAWARPTTTSSAGRAREDRLFLLHPPALRPRTAGRDPALRADRLLGHRHRPDP